MNLFRLFPAFVDFLPPFWGHLKWPGGAVARKAFALWFVFGQSAERVVRSFKADLKPEEGRGQKGVVEVASPCGFES